MDFALKLTLLIPTVPNYLMVDKIGKNADTTPSKVSISELSDAELDSIGKAWTEALKERARDIRNSPPSNPRGFTSKAAP